MSGLFAVNKPTGISSAGLLHDIQHVLSRSPLFAADLDAQAQRSAAGNKGRKRPRFSHKIKMGHGGTLDPLASGVLIVGVGKGTKQLGSFLGCSKEYEAIALFGIATDTYDSEGKIVSRCPCKHVTKALLERTIAAQFRGDIMQTPPIYSALKMQGKPLYEYAREGKPLPAEIKARPATVSRFDVTHVTTEHEWVEPKEEAAEEIRLAAQALKTLKPDPETELKHVTETEKTTESAKSDEKLVAVHLSMTVSSGTYVRSLIHDLGIAVGSAAHMVSLVRSRVGDYTLADALPPSAFQDGSWETRLSKTLQFEKSTDVKEAEEAARGPPASEKAIEGEALPATGSKRSFAE
ncbi:pseudouridine synthase [Protomyces lactucae-debilis]|uniref:tRNA pseudouridine(55) synthase n=1 Tax=Protomyces lactucae-debilis TaxID=2754530 RepID=A0A1Y2FQM6_PROLT|nr:pseudouridine synthase [Protomyces lactucae-debilis]ORY86301.1 pseudouridine synthase [Protomyces lactucae-debilis]